MTEDVVSRSLLEGPVDAPQDGVALIDQEVLAPFVDDAVAQYRRAWESAAEAADSGAEQYLPRCWALLIGRYVEGALQVDDLHFADNVRETDPVVLEEFQEVIVPSFGEGYTHKRRGFWCDPAELLRVSRRAEAEGRELLGSIHMHADMHRFWPNHARGLRLSEKPTPMDEYLFRSTGWPLNLICHLESWGGQIAHAFGAWTPAPFEEPEGRASARPVRFRIDWLRPGE